MVNNYQLRNLIYVIIGFFSMFINPIISLFINLLLLYCAPLKLRKIIILFLAMSLGIISYYTVPLPSDDLFRHYEQMNLLQNLKFNEIFEYGYSYVYLNTFIMYLISLTGKFGLYPMLYITIGYFLLFYMILDYAEMKDCSKRNIMLMVILVFFEFVFRDYISGLRNQFAFILCAFGIYIGFFKMKKMCRNLLFLASIFIHTASLLIIFCFVGFKFLKNLCNLKDRQIYILFFSIMPIMICLMSIIKFLNIDNAFMNKIIMYFTIFGYNNTNVMIFKFLIYFLSFITLIISNDESSKNDLKAFLVSYHCFTLGTILNMTLFYRMNYFIYCFNFIANFTVLERIDISRKLKIVIYVVIIIICLLSIALMYRSIIAYPWYFKTSPLKFLIFK